jgi:hypothetical protein
MDEATNSVNIGKKIVSPQLGYNFASTTNPPFNNKNG